jgi:hypothetical protein
VEEPGASETEVARTGGWRRWRIGLTGPGSGQQDGWGVEELGKAPTVEEATTWRSRPRLAAGGSVPGCQGPDGWAWCRGPVGGCGWRSGGASGKHRGSGGVRGRRPGNTSGKHRGPGGGARGRRPGGGARGRRPGGTSGGGRGIAKALGGRAVSVYGRLGASLRFEQK